MHKHTQRRLRWMAALTLLVGGGLGWVSTFSLGLTPDRFAQTTAIVLITVLIAGLLAICASDSDWMQN